MFSIFKEKQIGTIQPPRVVNLNNDRLALIAAITSRHEKDNYKNLTTHEIWEIYKQKVFNEEIKHPMFIVEENYDD